MATPDLTREELAELCVIVQESTNYCALEATKAPKDSPEGARLWALSRSRRALLLKIENAAESEASS